MSYSEYFRDALEKKSASDLTLEEAKDIIKKCLRLCFYRDCRASPQYHLAVVSAKDGAVVEEPQKIDSDWEYARTIQGYE